MRFLSRSSGARNNPRVPHQCAKIYHFYGCGHAIFFPSPRIGGVDQRSPEHSEGMDDTHKMRHDPGLVSALCHPNPGGLDRMV